MKTLYISDLDGTLFNEHALLSEYTKKMLNMLYKKGIDFSIATARTPYTVNELLKDINFRVPVTMMNGVMTYDFNKKEILRYDAIENSDMALMIDIFKKYNITGFFYAINGNGLNTYYENLDTPARKNFHDERVTRFHKPFTQIASLDELKDKEIVYISISDTADTLREAYEKVKEIDTVNVEYYRDIYGEGLWYMEISSAKASKGNAIEYLREHYNYDKLICFGDNYNDIKMFEKADECYAVANAKDDVKKAASGVIGSNKDNGVVNYIAKTLNMPNLVTIPKKIAMINDISGFGHCSTTVSLPVISALKVQCCPVLTSVFSNHTGFSDYYMRDFTPYMREYTDTWKKLNIDFDGIYSGYLSSETQIDIVRNFIEEFKTDKTVIIIDPVMGDHGKKYTFFTDSMCNKIKNLCSYADVLTPNITECALLTDTPYNDNFTISDIKDMIIKLSHTGAKKIVVTGFKSGNTITNICYANNQFELINAVLAGADRPGTGDIFASIIAACSVNGTDFYDSVKLASSFIGKCIALSDELNIPTPYGVCIENYLDELSTY